jgi:MFS family permease
MPEDIGANNAQFSTGISLLYVTYVLLETIWAVLIKKLTPKYTIGGLCVVWSLTTIFSGFITNVGGLYASRLVLGACESGLFPGLNVYLTMVYKREEMAKRVAYLFVCTALAGAFGGLLAYGILQMDGLSGVAGWRWVYIIEVKFASQHSKPLQRAHSCNRESSPSSWQWWYLCFYQTTPTTLTSSMLKTRVSCKSEQDSVQLIWARKTLVGKKSRLLLLIPRSSSGASQTSVYVRT